MSVKFNTGVIQDSVEFACSVKLLLKYALSSAKSTKEFKQSLL